MVGLMIVISINPDAIQQSPSKCQCKFPTTREHPTGGLLGSPSLGIGKSQEQVEGQSVLGNRIWERGGQGRGRWCVLQGELADQGVQRS
ncbi:hypothetical protein PGTUg99_020131 [Puccinia graminis f. sp. tritici]|uniref:Uncharacterized protein n=1 Tax=Puccinia graminis f. sp. tritici TaxID=56615 RepID=A0A5B0MRE5_PUCGR|nr:hypothetical protein PGTUg99_020131 [Puccinia graminis f. sp. tritici]